MPIAQFKSHHSSDTSLMYSVKITGDHLERKDTTAPKTPQSMCCNYKADFKLIVTKCFDENDILHHGNSMSCWRKQRTIIKTKNSN